MAEIEEEKVERAQQNGPGFRTRVARLLMGLVVLGLAATTLYLLAERNSKFYYLSQEGRRLVVSRGAWLPSGKRPYLPEDPHTAKIYAPILLPEDAGPWGEQRFAERQELDRALFNLLAGLAEERIQSEDVGRMEEGFSFVERASLLPGVSSEQAATLRLLRAELSFFEGRGHLEQAVVQLRQAREKLELATEASSARGEEASRLLRRIAPAAGIVTKALQRSKGWEVEDGDEEAFEVEEEAEEEAEAPLVEERRQKPAPQEPKPRPSRQPVPTAAPSRPTEAAPAKAPASAPAAEEGAGGAGAEAQ